ncbi:MAG: hypothetical protein OEV64_14380 [Desulfobulbaceae bacterium]|nr:hypothetical protein [Desulfobulbaceae bacterium]
MSQTHLSGLELIHAIESEREHRRQERLALSGFLDPKKTIPPDLMMIAMIEGATWERKFKTQNSKKS